MSRGELLTEAVERGPTLGIGSEDLLDDAGFVRINLDQGWIAGPLGMHAVAVRDLRGPGQQLTGFHLGQAAGQHAVRDQRPLVLGDRSTDVGHELLMRVMAAWTIDEHHLDSGALPFLEHHQLMDEVPRQAVRRGDDDHVELRSSHVIA